MGAGAAGTAALGLAACGDDYFEPATDHGDDAPNALLIVTDSTRADYISHYNPDSLAKTPNLDALARDSLTFERAVPEAMPTGPGAARAAHRRALVPVPQLRAHQGAAVGPGLDPDSRPPPDRDRD